MSVTVLPEYRIMFPAADRLNPVVLIAPADELLSVTGLAELIVTFPFACACKVRERTDCREAVVELATFAAMLPPLRVLSETFIADI